MSVFGFVLVVGIIILLVVPMWAIVACDFWRSIVFKDSEVNLPYPWAMCLIGPTIMSALCVCIAYWVKFNAWFAAGLCLFCVVNGMMSGFGELAIIMKKKDEECSLIVLIAYFAVIVVFLVIFMWAMNHVGPISFAN